MSKTTLTSVDQQVVEQKLQHEQEHLEALQRMRALRSYYDWSYQLLKEAIGLKVIDAGCGTGNFTELLADHGHQVLAIDLSPENLAVVCERFADKQNVKAVQYDLDDSVTIARLAEDTYDTIVCMDVLEHLADDRAMLSQFARVLPRGGTLCIKVPALPWLFGSVDEASDHYRRYTKDDLVSKVRSAGFTVTRSCYMNISGVIPYYLKSRVLKKKANLSRTFKPWQLSLIRTIMPMLKTMDTLTSAPIGQSVIVTARKD